jgi:excisionase family DNA binding protein
VLTQPERAGLLAEGLRTVSEAAAFIRVSRSAIYGLMGSGELAYTKIGRRRLIPHRALVELAERGLVPARGE